MDAFYEQYNEDRRSFLITIDADGTFPSHFHENVEIFILMCGEYEIVSNGIKYEIGAGTVIVFDSYDVHSYKSKLNGEKEKNVTLVIPKQFLERYDRFKGNRRILNPVIKNTDLCNSLYSLAKTVLTGNDEYVLQAGIDLTFAYIYKHLELCNGFENETSLIKGILGYVQQNFRNDISMSHLASYFGYTEAHLSRVFHRYMKRGFPEYVNSIRLKYMRARISSGDKINVTDLLFEAGFKSIQSYYRAKKISENSF